jgi:tetratricopeptide (TPR) repeat protein
MSFRFLPLLSFVLGALPVVASSAPETDTLRRSIDAQSAIETAAQATQQRIDALDARTRAAVVAYREALDATDSLRRYNDQMELQIASQANEQAALREQIEQLDVTSREIVPLLARMLETLEQFVALDAPFLRVERASRLDTLRDLMPRADVSIAEKYRRIAEAYQVEMEYGRTLEAYQAQLSDDDPRVVNLLRVGRIALMYQTLDGGESGYWDREQAAFVPDQRYHGAIREGLKVARKQAAPSLLRLPLQAAAGEVSP